MANELEYQAAVLKVLGDKTRLAIMALLKEREYCACDLLDFFDMSQPAISQHLKKLKALGLITETRRAQWAYYQINEASEHYPLVKAVLGFVAYVCDLPGSTCD